MSRVPIKPSAPADVWLEEPGTYRAARLDGRRTATMSCPRCGRPASLSGHEIAASGEVSPSVVCPHEPCGFHEFVTLEGWTP